MTRIRTALALALASSIILSFAARGETLTREQILTEADKVADAQLKAIGDKDLLDWTWGVMEVGYADYSHVSTKGAAYQQALTALADKAKWTPGIVAKNPNHADSFCITQTYLDLYATHPEPIRLAAVKARMDGLADHLDATATDPKLTFSWCDALFMAPPAMARLSAITKDPKYLDAMNKEYWRTTNTLYDRDEHLFYRDMHFLAKPDTNGKKIFWSRGNGWVLAGLAHVLQYMPADYPDRSKYETLFRQMSAKVITLQGKDGAWRANLADPDQFKGPETSGTSLFAYALAWGINNRLLDRETYLPVVAKAWSAMLTARRPDGLPGFSQPQGAQPALAKPTSTQVYTTGGYLLTASELQKLAPFDTPPTVALQDVPIYADTNPATPAQPAPDAKAFARYVPERMDDIAWENDRIAHRIYGPALQHNPKEHFSSGIDVWVKSVREPVINEWYKSGKYHINRGTGLDFYEVGHSRGDGGLGIWDNNQLYNSNDWVDHEILDLGPDECGFTLRYDPWDANGRKVWEHRKMTLKAGSNLTRIETTIDSDKPGEIIIGIGLAKRDGKGGKLYQDKNLGILSYWQPPEKNGTIGVGFKVDPATVVGFNEDTLNYLMLVKATAGQPYVYYTGACWDKGLDFHTSDEWEKYLKEFKPD